VKFTKKMIDAMGKLSPLRFAAVWLWLMVVGASPLK
jgi:hypothetical protein